MDDAVARLERAHAAVPDDAGVTIDLARAYVRAGRPARALAVLGPLDPGEREFAGRALAARLGLSFAGVVEGTDRFLSATPPDGQARELVLVHAGAFSPPDDEEGRGLARPFRGDVVVGAFLAELEPRPNTPGERDVAVEHGARLPSAMEWMKLWRGGRFLDGDDSRRVENPDPGRMLPRGLGLGRPAADSPYGALFNTQSAVELLQGGQGGVFHTSSGRYILPSGRGGSLAPVWRLVRDVPPEL